MVPTRHVKISVADDVGCVEEDPVDVALALLSDCSLENTRTSTTVRERRVHHKREREREREREEFEMEIWIETD